MSAHARFAHGDGVGDRQPGSSEVGIVDGGCGAFQLGGIEKSDIRIVINVAVRS
jgi:hypothetical protein